MSKRDKLKRLISKHPEIKALGYPDFHARYPKQDICPVEYYKVLRMVRERYKKVVGDFKTKADAIREELRKQLGKHGVEYVARLGTRDMEALGHPVTSSWFYRLKMQVIEGGKKDEIPPVEKVEDVLARKARELLELARAADVVVKIEDDKLFIRRMEELAIAL